MITYDSFTIVSVPGIAEVMQDYDVVLPHSYPQQLKSSVPKPDKSTIDETWVFNIIGQNYIKAEI